MTHLIPLLISFEIGLRKEFIIFGNDYNTKDGTCVRDYVHVLDICDAHLKALKYLTKFNEEHYFNLGSAVGFSVLDVVLELEKIIGKKVDFKLADRRVGDPATIVADNIKAKEILGWNPQFSSLENIISSALKWERQKLKSIN
jgi:UDP-glucose 4-epimerase